MTIYLEPKRSDVKLRYQHDWSKFLGDDTIASQETTSSDVTITNDDIVDGTAVGYTVAGGANGTNAVITQSIVTTEGDNETETFILPIADEAISLATAKAAQKIETDDEDALLAGYLRAAISTIEAKTGRNMTVKVETQLVDGFSGASFLRGRAGPAIYLYRGPVSAIQAVKYDDMNGIEQTLDDTAFRLVPGLNAKLLPAYNQFWPLTARGQGTIRISYLAGHTPADLPAELIQAAILLFGHFNANREAVIAGERAVAVELPLGVAALIEPYTSPWAI